VEEASAQDIYKKQETIDLSTPDKAIYSYWEYLDYVRGVRREPEIKRYIGFTRTYDQYLTEIRPVEQPFLETFFAREALLAGLKRIQEPEPYFADLMIDPRKAVQVKYRRVIQKVKFESDTRAKVECTVYNVTPLDNLRQPLREEQKNDRKRGTDFVYTMEKFEDGWKIIDRKWTQPKGFFKRYWPGRDYWHVDPEDN